MPRGKKRGVGRKAAVEAVDGTEEVDAEGNPIVSGELDETPTLGGAIDSIATALQPFDETTRKRIVRAAHMMLK